MRNPDFAKTYQADGGVPARRIVAFTQDVGVATLATGAFARLLGVNVQPGDVKDGERMDVALEGIDDVDFAVAAEAGDWVTADEDGRAIPATETGCSVIGRVMEPVEADCIGSVQILPGIFSARVAPDAPAPDAPVGAP